MEYRSVGAWDLFNAARKELDPGALGTLLRIVAPMTGCTKRRHMLHFIAKANMWQRLQDAEFVEALGAGAVKSCELIRFAFEVGATTGPADCINDLVGMLRAGAIELESDRSVAAFARGIAPWKSPDSILALLAGVMSEIDAFQGVGDFLRRMLDAIGHAWPTTFVSELLSLLFSRHPDLRDLSGKPRELFDAVPDYRHALVNAFAEGSDDEEADDNGNLAGFIAYSDDEEDSGTEGEEGSEGSEASGSEVEVDDSDATASDGADDDKDGEDGSDASSSSGSNSDGASDSGSDSSDSSESSDSDSSASSAPHRRRRAGRAAVAALAASKRIGAAAARGGKPAASAAAGAAAGAAVGGGKRLRPVADRDATLRPAGKRARLDSTVTEDDDGSDFAAAGAASMPPQRKRAVISDDEDDVDTGKSPARAQPATASVAATSARKPSSAKRITPVSIAKLKGKSRPSISGTSGSGSAWDWADSTLRRYIDDEAGVGEESE